MRQAPRRARMRRGGTHAMTRWPAIQVRPATPDQERSCLAPRCRMRRHPVCRHQPRTRSAWPRRLPWGSTRETPTRETSMRETQMRETSAHRVLAHRGPTAPRWPGTSQRRHLAIRGSLTTPTAPAPSSPIARRGRTRRGRTRRGRTRRGRTRPGRTTPGRPPGLRQPGLHHPGLHHPRLRCRRRSGPSSPWSAARLHWRARQRSNVPWPDPRPAAATPGPAGSWSCQAGTGRAGLTSWRGTGRERSSRSASRAGSSCSAARSAPARPLPRC